MSFREGKLLKRLVSQAKINNEKVDFSTFTYYFPGKSDSFLEKHYYSLFGKSKKHK